jgi:hypothetical protein
MESAIKAGRTGKRGQKRIAGADDGAGDLEQSRRVTERTILPIAALLTPESAK